MREEVLTSLRRLQPTLRRHWERRLRERPVVSAMALPDQLDPQLDRTLDSIWTDLRNGRSRETVENDWSVSCVCRANPLTEYFLCVKQTFLALFEQDAAALPSLTPGEKQMCSLEILRALDRVAAREIQTFCSVCQQKQNYRPCDSVKSHPGMAAVPVPSTDPAATMAHKSDRS